MTIRVRRRWQGSGNREQNWTAVRQLVGYLRYDTAGELLLLSKIWVLQSLIGNHFYPQQKLISKVRDGAKISKKYDTAATPYTRVIAPPTSRHCRNGGCPSSTTGSTRPPCNDRSGPSPTSSSRWPLPRANPLRDHGSPAPTAGPFQVRQRSAAPGPLDMRQRAIHEPATTSHGNSRRTNRRPAPFRCSNAPSLEKCSGCLPARYPRRLRPPADPPSQ